MMGEKLKCKVILPRNEMWGEINEYYFFRILSIYARYVHSPWKSYIT